MSVQEHAHRSTEAREGEPATEVSVKDPEKAARDEKLKADLDDILDEIDDVLETNAEEFVRSYVQKGGQ